MSCPDCITGVNLPGTPKGVLRDDGSYYAAAPEGSNSDPKKRAILLLTDAFGLGLDNPKIMADYFAKELECDVWIPDIFSGKPLIGENELKMPEKAGDKIGFLGWTRFYLTVLRKAPRFISNRPRVVDKRIKRFLNKIKAEYRYEDTGAVGYCFGGACCARLACIDALDTVVICHPANFSLKLVDKFIIPVSFVCAEDDFTFSTNKRERAERMLEERAKDEKRALDYEFHDYEGTVHGFAARPNTQLPEIREAFEKSLQQTVCWFKKKL